MFALDRLPNRADVIAMPARRRSTPQFRAWPTTSVKERRAVKQIKIKEMETLPTRREFCVGACRAMSVAGLAALLPGCGGGGGSPMAPSGNVGSLTVVNATVSGGAVVVPVDASSPLAAVGGAAFVQSSGGSFLVARTSQDAFVAFTTICTHQNCTITGFQNQLFVCPCHGSEYDFTGHPVVGPAVNNLRQFATSFANNVLTITG